MSRDVRPLLAGCPRAGQLRELKWLLERAWRGGVEPREPEAGLGAARRGAQRGHTALPTTTIGNRRRLARVDVDVAAIEFARSDDEHYLVAFAEVGWDSGPGVLDVHSPHRPGTDAVVDRLRRGLEIIPRERLWLNPECGLKTRSWPEVEAQLADMLAGSAEIRETLAEVRS